MLFSFVPLLIIYLASISSFLSLFYQLNKTNFYMTQIVILAFLYLLINKNLNSYWQTDKKILTKPIFLKNRDWLTNVLLILISLVTLISLWTRSKSEVFHIDNWSYRGSAPLHWIQNRSIYPFFTLNERKSVFIYSSGIIFMWPLMFTQSEQIASIFFGMAIPITVLLLYFFVPPKERENRMYLLMIFAFLTSPYIYEHITLTLGQEIWLAPVLLIYTFCLKNILFKTDLFKAQYWQTCFLLSITAVLLITIKINSALYLLTLILLIKCQNYWQIIKQIIVYFFITMFFTGYILAMLINTKYYGSPLGSYEFLKNHNAVISINQIKTHLTRIPFILFDFPAFSKNNAILLSEKGNILAQKLGATKILFEEDTYSWLNTFKYTNTWPNSGFGFFGIIILFYSLIFFFKFKFNNIKHKFILIFFVSSILQIIWIRWAEGSKIPHRHIISSTVLFISNMSLIFTTEKSKNWNSAVIIISMLFLSLTPWIASEINNPSWEKSFYYNKSYFNVFSKNSKFLIIDNFDFYDYPYFFKNNKIVNQVFIFTDRPRLSGYNLITQLEEVIQKKDIDYLVFSNEDKELYLLKDRFQYMNEYGRDPLGNVILANERN